MSATRTITIDPVTRIEGHGKITLQLDEKGKLADARFHVTQFRGFEKFVEGRPLTEMPSVMARICGICPVSHSMASAKACDALLAVEIPVTAVKLRKLMHLAQLVQSHALSFFHLTSPDLLLGMDADPAIRNVVGLAQKHPEMLKDGIALRRLGQDIIALLGGKRIHPAWVVAGGVAEPLDAERRDKIAQMLPRAMEIARRTIDWYKTVVGKFSAEIESFANFPSMHMGTVGPGGLLEQYHGGLRFVDAAGKIVTDGVAAADYQTVIGEAVEKWSYMKFPYYLPAGYPAGFYRVGPLARLNVADRCGTPLADRELEAFRKHAGRPAASSFHFHWARLIEIINGLEVMQQLVDSPDILETFVRARARPNRFEGVGIVEAPRGTLIHHYKIDRNGQMTWANLIVATGHNNLAISRGVKQVAERFVDGTKLREGMLNRCEALVRCFDPCLSCATHALGQMALIVELRDAQGQVLDEMRRG